MSTRLGSDGVFVVFVFSIVRASTIAQHCCATRTSAATRSATWRTCRQHQLPPSMSTSPT
jgi:hypothetical protein